MKTFKIILLSFFCCISTFTIFGQKNINNKEHDILGNWSILDNQIAIEILKVEEKLQGRIIWLSEPNDQNGLPKLDKNNLDKTKRYRALMFLICLYDFEYNSISNSFENGYFYNPLTGDTVKATLKIGANNTLIMSGFTGFSLTFEEAVWVRM